MIPPGSRFSLNGTCRALLLIYLNLCLASPLSAQLDGEVEAPRRAHRRPHKHTPLRTIDRAESPSLLNRNNLEARRGALATNTPIPQALDEQLLGRVSPFQSGVELKQAVPIYRMPSLSPELQPVYSKEAQQVHNSPELGAPALFQNGGGYSQQVVGGQQVSEQRGPLSQGGDQARLWHHQTQGQPASYQGQPSKANTDLAQSQVVGSHNATNQGNRAGLWPQYTNNQAPYNPQQSQVGYKFVQPWSFRQGQEAKLSSSVTNCGYVRVPETGLSHCYGGWKCGCMVSDPSDFSPAVVHYQPVQPVMGLPTSVLASMSQGLGDYHHRDYRRRCKRQGGGCPGEMMMYCFAADTRVQLGSGSERDGRAGNGWVRMDELKVGDWVETGAGSSRVDSWIHRLPDLEADFLRLHLHDGRELKLTEKHFIYRAQCALRPIDGLVPELVYVDELAVGDCVLASHTAKSGSIQGRGLIPTKVVEISLVRERGIYSPMTANGKILVEGVLASAFTMVKSDIVQSAVFKSTAKSQNAIVKVEEVNLPFGLPTIVALLEEVVLPSGPLEAAEAESNDGMALVGLMESMF